MTDTTAKARHPRSVTDVDPLDLSITGTHDDGNQHTVHVTEDRHLGAKLHLSSDSTAGHVQGDAVVLILGLDGNHDTVSIHGSSSISEMIGRAQDALSLVKQGLGRVGGHAEHNDDAQV